MTIEAIHMEVEVHGLNLQRQANLDELVGAVTASILNTKRGFQVGGRDVHPGDVSCNLKRVEGEFSDRAENDALKDQNVEHISHPKGERSDTTQSDTRTNPPADHTFHGAGETTRQDHSGESHTWGQPDHKATPGETTHP